MPEENDSPQPPPPPEPPTLLGGAAPDELFARGMQTVKMTGGAGGWTPPTIAETAQLFPGYEVLKLLGRGGMGAVYQARQIELDRLVAIKLLPLEISVDQGFADRFRREARAMARLHHPNIITVFDFGTTREGHLFFVMEFVEGANLADIIREASLDAAQALSLVEQVCTALAYAHHKGIIHRDIKPANVMITTESEVKVADFGLARLTDPSAEQMGHTVTGTVMGTPDYMAPEQMKGMNVDHRADIYSVGVMLYEMLCREVPKGIFDPPSHRTGCDARIDAIVIRAMQQAPDRRYQSTTEMKADITAARTPTTLVPVGPTQVVHPHPVVRPALPQSPAAEMKAIAPAVAKKKSAFPMFAAIIAVLLAIGTGAYLLLRPAREDLTAAQIEALKASIPPLEPGSVESTPVPAPSPSPAANAVAPANRLSPSTEPWREILKALPAGEGRVWLPDGSLRAETRQYLGFPTAKGADGAIRALCTLPADAFVELKFRTEGNGPGTSYRFGVNHSEATLMSTSGEPVTKTIHRATFSKDRRIIPDGPVELELRIVGRHLSGRINGQVVCEGEDEKIATGYIGMVLSPGTIVHAVEALLLPPAAER